MSTAVTQKMLLSHHLTQLPEKIIYIIHIEYNIRIYDDIKDIYIYPLVVREKKDNELDSSKYTKVCITT